MNAPNPARASRYRHPRHGQSPHKHIQLKLTTCRFPTRIRAVPADLCHAQGMDDGTILSRIGELVDEEHQLRARAQLAQTGTDEDRVRLRELEESLDQCWDLLRRRRAARRDGDEPNSAGVRSRSEVERYLQ